MHEKQESTQNTQKISVLDIQPEHEQVPGHWTSASEAFGLRAKDKQYKKNFEYVGSMQRIQTKNCIQRSFLTQRSFSYALRPDTLKFPERKCGLRAWKYFAAITAGCVSRNISATFEFSSFSPFCPDLAVVLVCVRVVLWDKDAFAFTEMRRRAKKHLLSFESDTLFRGFRILLWRTSSTWSELTRASSFNLE